MNLCYKRSIELFMRMTTMFSWMAARPHGSSKSGLLHSKFKSSTLGTPAYIASEVLSRTYNGKWFKSEDLRFFLLEEKETLQTFYKMRCMISACFSFLYSLRFVEHDNMLN